MGELVDLDAYRKMKQEEEEAEIRRIEAERDEEIEAMQHILTDIISELRDSNDEFGMYYIPMTEDEQFMYWRSHTGYNDDGDFESTWEWKGGENIYYELEDEPD